MGVAGIEKGALRNGSRPSEPPRRAADGVEWSRASARLDALQSIGPTATSDRCAQAWLLLHSAGRRHRRPPLTVYDRALASSPLLQQCCTLCKPVVPCLSTGRNSRNMKLLWVLLPVLPSALCAVSGNNSDPLFWGTYRPNLYFGLRPKIPQSLMTGLMWFGTHDYQSIQSERCAFHIRSSHLP